ncbi:DIS3-like exonuclease 2 isoform X1 [Octopus bimaculoides]|uniref:DIS3-like exonuclease 2 isoform X1 n=2 Tax=Octopus bimaculoides TaxID=37653 RepID=UPI00071D506A|nr:DIS3-like exonuclease 2 isoform X1 [Octopus bimaculoides]XP_052822104.1 DIS3-like exonuclease 2 isoform X1 [Octopus bimaculoides]|eukprot:XP_014776921.1 PREDICTED: DIS3-like exonuclease 2 isoform X1 [Octopus bimaculoides]
MMESCKIERNPAQDAIEQGELPVLATVSKSNQKNPQPLFSDKSFEEELIRRVSEIQLVRENLSAIKTKRKNKKSRSHKSINSQKNSDAEKTIPKEFEERNKLKNISREKDDFCELKGSSDSDNESCECEHSEEGSQTSLKQKRRRRRVKKSRKKTLSIETELLDTAIIKCSGIGESVATDLEINDDKMYIVEGQSVKQLSNLDLKQVSSTLCTGKKLKKKKSSELDNGQKSSDKCIVAKTKEVKGSYSQLLEEVEKPLFYQPADEIVLLLSSMAHRGGSNPMDPHLNKNCNNQPPNKQNYRPQFKQTYPQPPNGILGHAPHNFTPMYKMSNQAQPPPNNQTNNTSYKIEDIEEQVKNNPNLIIGEIRINPKDYKDCYVPHPDGHSDIYICGTKNRNSALNGDLVLVLINDKTKWKVNKKEMDSNFTSESDDNDGIEQLLANTSITDDPAVKDAKPAAVSSCGSPQALLNKDLQPVTCQEASNESRANASVDANLKRTPQKKDLPGKKYTSIGDLNQDVNLQRVLEDRKSVDMYIQRTGKVLLVLEEKHPRKCIGHLGLANNKCVRFNPIDSRIPRLSVPLLECPKEYLQRPEDFSRVLFVAKILNQNASGTLTQGSLLQCLGESGDIETETKGILIENDIDESEFPDSVTDSLPIDCSTPWTVPKEEYSNRRDLTKQCIFTIDPASARDLDDAVSCEILEEGLYEIGVHIADVSYFLKEATSLDKVAASRATSVYLTQRVIPMLPQILCEKLCSLNPNEPRLTFSVIWHINDKAEIVNEWFGRSIINSCAKLSYDHAQGFINDPSHEYTKEQLPPISGFSINDIKSRILTLHKIASILRDKRFEGGALRLDKVKLQWLLNNETYLPMGYFVYERRESNQLIEEFMLLANMAVAHRIHKSFPEKCLLRRHPEPQTRMIDSLNDFCRTTNIEMDITSAGAIHRSLLQHSGDDEYSSARLQVLIAKCSKPMKLAQYFCSGTISNKNEYRHYALNVPLYTHFTSPIRRYADVIVHRLLAAALGYTPPIQQTEREMEKQAQHCNDKKTASKRAQELSCEIFLGAFIQASGPLYEKGMVMAILDHSFDVYILRLGVVKRVYCNKLDLQSHTAFKRKRLPMLRLQWKENEHIKESVSQEIGIFTLVKCILQGDSEPLKWLVTITHPKL